MCQKVQLVLCFLDGSVCRGNFSRNENVQFKTKVGSFFLFPRTAHDAQTFCVCRVVGVLYITSVSCHCDSETRGGGFKARFRP